MKKKRVEPQVAPGNDLSAALGLSNGKGFPKKRLLIIAAALLLLSGTAVALVILLPRASQTASDTVYREYTVMQGDVVVGQTESSSISLQRETITLPVSATVEEVFVKPGSSVKEGDPLVRLNADDITESLKSYDLQLEIMGLEVEQARLQLDTKLLQAKQQLETSKESGSLAGDNHALSIAELQLTYDKAAASLQTAQDELQKYSKLSTTFEKDYRYLSQLKGSVEYWQERVADLQEQATATTDYSSLRKTAEEELTSAWKLFNSAAATLDYITDCASVLAASGTSYTSCNDLAAYVKRYYSMDTSPGVIGTGSDSYADIQQLIAGWVATAAASYSSNVALTTSLNTLLSAHKAMDTQATNVRNYTQSSAGSATAAASVQTSLTSAQSSLSNYKELYNEYKSTFSETYGSISDIDDLTSKIETLSTDVATAELNLTKASITSQTGETSATQQKETALSAAALAKSTYELTEMELAQAVDSAQDKYRQFNIQIEDARSMLSDDGIVYAPCNGMVSSVSVSAGDSVSVSINKQTDTNSMQLSSYAQLLIMTNISDVYVPITISEEDILNVSIGQQASVTMTAFSDEKFEAEVDSIAVEASRAGAATISYTVTVRFSEQNWRDMYEGMSASVTLIQRAAVDVLYINAQAVTFADGVSTVLRKNSDGQAETVQVETGFSNGQYVEIISGLSVGDVVMVESAVGRS